jgi:hypothetical protein
MTVEQTNNSKRKTKTNKKQQAQSTVRGLSDLWNVFENNVHKCRPLVLAVGDGFLVNHLQRVKMKGLIGDGFLVNHLQRVKMKGLIGDGFLVNHLQRISVKVEIEVSGELLNQGTVVCAWSRRS